MNLKVTFFLFTVRCLYNKGWRTVLQKLWILQNFCWISWVSQSRFLSGYVRLAVSFFIRRCLRVSKHFEFSVLQSKKSKCLRLAKKNASLAVSQSLAFTIRNPYNRPTNNCMNLLSNMGFLLSCLIWEDISIPLCAGMYCSLYINNCIWPKYTRAASNIV